MRSSIALTFDDGPSEGTLPLLEVLEIRGVKATFFECGMNVRRLPIARRVVGAGHQLGHGTTWSHPKLPFKFAGCLSFYLGIYGCSAQWRPIRYCSGDCAAALWVAVVGDAFHAAQTRASGSSVDRDRKGLGVAW